MQAAHRELPNLWQSEYVLDRELGRGAFGVALLARKQGKLVVVKQINVAKQGPKEREVAYQEAQVLKQFCHNNVIRFIDAEVAAANLFIVMEYADGGDLSERIAQRKRRVSSPYFVESYVCHILAQIVLALRHIHRHRILHRDLKPQNVFLHGPNDIVKLGDFGVARVLQHTRDLAATQLGTPYFMSPEVWNGHEYGAKSDVWSLGCILYELLAFRVPFDGANIVELSRAVVQQQAPALPVRVTPTMRQLVTTLLSKKASGRPSAEQLCFHPIIEYHVNTLFSYTFHEDREHCGVDEDNLVDSAVQGQHELEELREIEVLAKKQKETERQRAEIRHLVQNAAGTHAEAQQPKRQAGVYDSNTAHQVYLENRAAAARNKQRLENELGIGQSEHRQHVQGTHTDDESKVVRNSDNVATPKEKRKAPESSEQDYLAALAHAREEARAERKRLLRAKHEREQSLIDPGPSAHQDATRHSHATRNDDNASAKTEHELQSNGKSTKPDDVDDTTVRQSERVNALDKAGQEKLFLDRLAKAREEARTERRRNRERMREHYANDTADQPSDLSVGGGAVDGEDDSNNNAVRTKNDFKIEIYLPKRPPPEPASHPSGGSPDSQCASDRTAEEEGSEATGSLADVFATKASTSNLPSLSTSGSQLCVLPPIDQETRSARLTVTGLTAAVVDASSSTLGASQAALSATMSPPAQVPRSSSSSTSSISTQPAEPLPNSAEAALATHPKQDSLNSDHSSCNSDETQVEHKPQTIAQVSSSETDNELIRVRELVQTLQEERLHLRELVGEQQRRAAEDQALLHSLLRQVAQTTEAQSQAQQDMRQILRLQGEHASERRKLEPQEHSGTLQGQQQRSGTGCENMDPQQRESREKSSTAKKQPTQDKQQVREDTGQVNHVTTLGSVASVPGSNTATEHPRLSSTTARRRPGRRQGGNGFRLLRSRRVHRQDDADADDDTAEGDGQRQSNSTKVCVVQ